MGMSVENQDDNKVIQEVLDKRTEYIYNLSVLGIFFTQSEYFYKQVKYESN